jgi:hypothetical protein
VLQVAIHPELQGARIQIIRHPYFAGYEAIVEEASPNFSVISFEPPVPIQSFVQAVSKNIGFEIKDAQDIAEDALNAIEQAEGLERDAAGNISKLKLFLEPGTYRVIEAQKLKFFDLNSTKNEGRKRLIDPLKFDQESFRRWNKWGELTIPKGLSLVVGNLLKPAGKKQPGEKAVQAIRFNKAQWTEEDAKRWFDKNQSYFIVEWTEEDWKKVSAYYILSNKVAGVSPSYQRTVQNPSINKVPDPTADRVDDVPDDSEDYRTVYKYKVKPSIEEEQEKERLSPYPFNPNASPSAYRPSPKLGS